MNQFLPASEGTQFSSESILEPYATLKIGFTSMKIGISKYILGWEINLRLSNVNDVRIFLLLSNGDFHMQACEFHFHEDDSLYTSTWNLKLQFSDILASPSLQISFAPLPDQIFQKRTTQEHSPDQFPLDHLSFKSFP